VEFLVSINGAVVILGTVNDGVDTAELSVVGPTDLTENTLFAPYTVVIETLVNKPLSIHPESPNGLVYLY
jgi:hypothetical protein